MHIQFKVMRAAKPPTTTVSHTSRPLVASLLTPNLLHSCHHSSILPSFTAWSANHKLCRYSKSCYLSHICNLANSYQYTPRHHLWTLAHQRLIPRTAIASTQRGVAPHAAVRSTQNMLDCCPKVQHRALPPTVTNSQACQLAPD